MSRGMNAIPITLYFSRLFVYIDKICILKKHCFYPEKGSNKRTNDEFSTIEELEKQKVRDEQGPITNSLKEADEENLECKGHKSDSDEDVKSRSESNADSDADVMFLF